MSNHSAVLGGRQASVSGLELTDLSTARVPRGPAGLGWTPAQRCGEDTDGDLHGQQGAWEGKPQGALMEGRQGTQRGRGHGLLTYRTQRGPERTPGWGRPAPVPGQE